MCLMAKIERYLRLTNTSATAFGRRSVNDPRLVHDLRRGREMRPQTAARVEAFLGGRPA